MAYLKPNDEEKRPEDQRNDAHDRLRCGPPAGFDRLFQPIERAGADIAVDDTKRREHHNGGLLPGTLPRDFPGLKGISH